jgi:hypothetical protein
MFKLPISSLRKLSPHLHLHSNRINFILKKNLINLNNASRTSKTRAAMFDDIGNLIDEATYYKLMKSFMKETAGLPKFSQKWWDIRNRYYKEIYHISNVNQFKEIETTDVKYIHFYLIVVPELTPCYELLAVLNYYDFRYKTSEDSPISRSIMRQMLGIFQDGNYENYKYPFFQFESSDEPRVNLDGYENIVRFLIDNNFINEYRTHSPYEKDGIVLASEFEKVLDRKFQKLGNKFNFYFRTTNFIEARHWSMPSKDGNVFRTRILSRIYRMIKYFITDWLGSKKDNKKDNNNDLPNLMQTWIVRLNSLPFHGGDIPDGADFKLYSILKKFIVCRKIRSQIRLINNNKFDDWHSLMDMLCSRDFHRKKKVAGYEVNPYTENEKDILDKKKLAESDEAIPGAFGRNKIKRNIINL